MNLTKFAAVCILVSNPEPVDAGFITCTTSGIYHCAVNANGSISKSMEVLLTGKVSVDSQLEIICINDEIWVSGNFDGVSRLQRHSEGQEIKGVNVEIWHPVVSDDRMLFFTQDDDGLKVLHSVSWSAGDLVAEVLLKDHMSPRNRPVIDSNGSIWFYDDYSATTVCIDAYGTVSRLSGIGVPVLSVGGMLVAYVNHRPVVFDSSSSEIVSGIMPSTKNLVPLFYDEESNRFFFTKQELRFKWFMPYEEIRLVSSTKGDLHLHYDSSYDFYAMKMVDCVSINPVIVEELWRYLESMNAAE